MTSLMHLMVHTISLVAIVLLSLALVRNRRQTQRLANEVAKRSLAESQLRYLACHDDLTGLPNRRSFDTELAQALHAAHDDFSGTLLMIDVDRFKSVNDTYGHVIADKVLVQLAAMLKDNLREQDRLFRWGGDEFVAILPNADLEVAKQIAHTLRSTVSAATFLANGNSVQVGVSIGMAAITPCLCGEDVLELADTVMLTSKQRQGTRREGNHPTAHPRPPAHKSVVRPEGLTPTSTSGPSAPRVWPTT